MQYPKFHSEIVIQKNSFNLNHFHSFITLGSCFADNVAEKLKHLRFNSLGNPFGVLYNPASIYHSLNIIAKKEALIKDNLIYYNDEWHSFFHHSDFSSHDPDRCLKNINDGIKQTREFLLKTDIAIITYGTAYVYNYTKRDIIVSNCHKIPAAEFKRKRLSIDDASTYMEKTISLLRKFNPQMKFIFTVSPIRHLKDGFTKNQLSKSTLLLAVNKIVRNNPDCHYFPAYEIMMDDLRDYRFYEANLTHPNQIAIDYIWQKFSDAFFTEECLLAIRDMEKLNRARGHKPRNKRTKGYKEFCDKQISFIDQLKQKYPHLNFDEELAHFQEE